MKFKAPRAEFVPQIRWITKQNRLDARPVIILFWWWRFVLPIFNICVMGALELDVTLTLKQMRGTLGTKKNLVLYYYVT